MVPTRTDETRKLAQPPQPVPRKQPAGRKMAQPGNTQSPLPLNDPLTELYHVHLETGGVHPADQHLQMLFSSTLSSHIGVRQDQQSNHGVTYTSLAEASM